MLQCGINHRLKRQQGIRENTICCGVSCQHTICCGATIHESILFRIVEYPIAYRFSRKSRRDQGSRGYERHKYHKPISKTPLVKLHKRVSKNTGFYFNGLKRFCNICTKEACYGQISSSVADSDSSPVGIRHDNAIRVGSFGKRNRESG